MRYWSNTTQHTHPTFYKRGQAMIIATLFFVAGSLIIMGGVARPLLQDKQNIRQLIESKQSYLFAEGSVEDVVYRLGTGLTVSSSELLVSGIYSATTTTTSSGGEKEVESMGDVGRAIRKIKTTLIEGTGINFFYGAHIGEGGVTLQSNATVNGNVYSNANIDGTSNATINGDAAAVGTVASPGPIVIGSVTEGVPTVALPTIDLDFWRAAANVNNDPIVGDYESSGVSTFGPQKFEGDLTLDGNSQMTITGPIYITGNFILDSNSDLFLDESFGSSGTVIVVDGTIEVNSNVEIFATSASPQGYILLVTPSPSSSAIEINSNSLLEVSVYATTGTVIINSNGDLVAVTAHTLLLGSNAEINYDVGLASAVFTSGPSGGFSISNWEEVE